MSMADGGAERVLVVDDVAENVSILADGLADHFDVRVAMNGLEALRIVNAEDPIDLILLDVVMPGMNGFDVLRALRRTQRSRKLPVIMVSVREDRDSVIKALELGANDYVSKPIDLQVLKARIRAQMRTATPSNLNLLRSTVSERGCRRSRDLRGEIIADTYRLEEQIGAGGFGAVYRATHLFLQKQVALKVLKTHMETPEHLARFQREGRAASQLRHPNAVSVLDFGVADGQAYLVMELLKGSSLRSEMCRAGPLSYERFFEILLPVCNVLSASHQIGLLHRDLKPDNIFLHRPCGRETVKVVDFGTAKLLDSAENLTAKGVFVGTPKYMAPERLCVEPYDAASDIYSLGIMAYEMLSGRSPFPPTRDMQQVMLMHLNQEPLELSELVTDLDDDLAAVVMETLDKDPAERPSAEELECRLAAARARLSGSIN